MTVNQNLIEFYGKPVYEYPQKKQMDPARVAYRVQVEWDGQLWEEKFTEFLTLPEVEKTTALVVGSWIQEKYIDEPADPIVRALVAAHEKLPNLEALFFGDITFEQFEISWIQNTDLSPILTTYPHLKVFRVRGAEGLSLGNLQLPQLQHLGVECGGLPQRVLNQVINSQLPELTHLELWLGTRDYGRHFNLLDLAPMLENGRFPKLSYLGLRDAEDTDDLIKLIVDAPILDQIDILDLSMGDMTDVGAEALIQCRRIRNLKKLDLHHHFCSDEMVRRMKTLPIPVDMSDQQEEGHYSSGEAYRYVAVSE
jgi:hypothetical protein